MRRLPLLAVLCLLAPAPAIAAAADGPAGTDPRFDRGSWELALRVVPNGGMQPAIGYFLADNVSLNVQVGISAVAFQNPAAPDDELNQGEVDVEVLFDIPTHGPLVPFVGAGGGVFSQEVKLAGTTSSDVDGRQIYGVGGLRFLVGAIASINLYLSAGATTFDDNLAGTSQDGGFADLGVSYSLFF
jgi:hypothetical protein